MIQLGRLKWPLSPEQFEVLSQIEDSLKIQAIVKIDFCEISKDIELLNDQAEELILGLNSGVLSDIAYRVVEALPGNQQEAGSMLIEVTANIDFL